MGRRRLVLDLAEVQRLAAEGHTEEGIALALGVSVKTLERRRGDTDGFDAAIKRGRQQAHSTISNVLYQQAQAGNLTAIIWYEKTRRGFRDVTDVTSGGAPIKVYQGIDPEAL